jgi:hypothetical protein
MFGASALRISKGGDESDITRRDRLVARIRKCLILAQQEPHKWTQWAQMLDSTREELQKVRDELPELHIRPDDTRLTRKLLADRVARYRPML